MTELVKIMLHIAGTVMCFVGMRTAEINNDSKKYWLFMCLVEITITAVHVFKHFY